MILILSVFLKGRVEKMIISIIYLFICLVLEVLMSNFFPSTFSSVSLFTTIYTIIGLVILYPHFNNDKKFFLLAIICGVLFDILYTSTFMFNLVLFAIVGIMIKFLYNVFPENIFMTNLISFIVIMIYHILCFVLLNLLSAISYDFILLINIITHSIIMTIIFTSSCYYIIKFVFNKYGVKYVK